MVCVELHLLHQLLGQRKDFVFGAENIINSDAAGDLPEVKKLHFQCLMNMVSRNVILNCFI